MVEIIYSTDLHDSLVLEEDSHDDKVLFRSPTPSDDTLLYKLNLSDETHDWPDYNTTDSHEQVQAQAEPTDIHHITSGQISWLSHEIWHLVEHTIPSMDKYIPIQEIWL